MKRYRGKPEFDESFFRILYVTHETAELNAGGKPYVIAAAWANG
ncbi:MAG: hypothetical protein P8182_10715 [Deltaproteobacteria bacterium]